MGTDGQMDGQTNKQMDKYLLKYSGISYHSLMGVRIIHDSCGTGPDINVGDQIGVVDVVAALNSDLRDVAILQQQRTSLQQPEIVGNTNINNENQE
jgi:hypothetical protein